MKMLPILAILSTLSLTVLPTLAHADPGACPDSAALQERVAKAWKVNVSRVADGAILCAPGHFPTPGWIVYAYLYADQEHTKTFARFSVIDASGKAIFTQDESPDKSRMATVGDVEKLQAADLDGDGTDEIIAGVSSAYKYEPTSSSVAVYAFRGTTLAPVFGRGYAFTTAERMDGNGGMEDICTGSYDITPAAPRALVVKGTITKRSDLAQHAHDCVDGNETYVMKAGAMVKQ